MRMFAVVMAGTWAIAVGDMLAAIPAVAVKLDGLGVGFARVLASVGVVIR